MNRLAWHYAVLAFVSIVWGINFAVSRWAMDVFPAEVFVLFRFGLAVPILFALLRVTEGHVRIDRKDLPALLLIGLVGVTVLELAVMYSIKYTTLANASLLNVAPWPIFAALFAPLFTKEALTRRLVAGGGIAMFGVALIILGGGEGFDLSSEYMLGNLIALGISFFGALFNLACMPLMKKYSALRVTAWYMLFGVVFLLPMTWTGWAHVQWSEADAVIWGAIAYNVLLCTVAAFVLWNIAMKRVGATKSNFFRYLVPAAAAVAGAMFFGEPVLPLQIVGGGIVVLALVWIGTERAKRRDA